MSAATVALTPIPYGWSVVRSDGRLLARFFGPGARWRALRYVAGLTRSPAPRPWWAS